MLDNMALTSQLHPWSLMIEAEETGRVSRNHSKSQQVKLSDPDNRERTLEMV